MTYRKKIFLVTALLYILYTVFPLFADVFHIPVWMPSLTAVAVMVALYPNAFANKVFYWFWAYAGVLGFYLLIGRPLTIGIGSVADSRKILIEFAFILPSISIFSILVYLKDMVVLRKLVVGSVIMLFASFLVAVPLMLRYESIRAALQTEQRNEIRVVGLPGYALMHAYTLFLPALCYAVKVFTGRKRRWAWIGLAVLCFVVYDTFVTTSLLVMIVVLLYSLLYAKKNKEVFLIISVFLAILFYILYKEGFFISLVDWMMPAFEGTPVEPKLEDFKQSMIHGQATGDTIDGRQHLHAISWDSFFRNPLFGSSVVGGHSSLLDRFGGMGLLVGIPFIMLIVSFVKRMLKLFETKMARDFFWLGVLAGFVYLYQKGLWGCEGWLMYMILMPMGILAFENNWKEFK